YRRYRSFRRVFCSGPACRYSPSSEAVVGFLSNSTSRFPPRCHRGVSFPLARSFGINASATRVPSGSPVGTGKRHTMAKPRTAGRPPPLSPRPRGRGERGEGARPGSGARPRGRLGVARRRAADGLQAVRADAVAEAHRGVLAEVLLDGLPVVLVVAD